MSASEWCVICKTPVSALLCQRCAPAFGIVERIITSAKAEARLEALEDAVRVVQANPGGTEIHVEAIRALAKEPKP